MKKIIILGMLALMAACGSKTSKTESSEFAQTCEGTNCKVQFKVWGNCEMCKETIEGSLKTDGVTKADWNTESKQIAVEYDNSKISLEDIQKKIAAVGYDNVAYAGDDNAYKNLPGCCQYERK